jgi:polyisoprenoid-binding protein YceI
MGDWIRRTCGVGLSLLALTVDARSHTQSFDVSLQTSVRFACATGLMAVQGEFQEVHGAIAIEQSTPQTQQIRATIAAGSLTTGQMLLDSQLKAPGFFDAAAFPVIEFESQPLPVHAGTPARIMGTLTMKGVSRPVTLDVEVAGRRPPPTSPDELSHSPQQGQTVLATTRISRSQFGMTGYEFLVSDDCGIRIEVGL